MTHRIVKTGHESYGIYSTNPDDIILEADSLDELHAEYKEWQMKQLEESFDYRWKRMLKRFENHGFV